MRLALLFMFFYRGIAVTEMACTEERGLIQRLSHALESQDALGERLRESDADLIKQVKMIGVRTSSSGMQSSFERLLSPQGPMGTVHAEDPAPDGRPGLTAEAEQAFDVRLREADDAEAPTGVCGPSIKRGFIRGFLQGMTHNATQNDAEELRSQLRDTKLKLAEMEAKLAAAGEQEHAKKDSKSASVSTSKGVSTASKYTKCCRGATEDACCSDISYHQCCNQQIQACCEDPKKIAQNENLVKEKAQEYCKNEVANGRTCCKSDGNRLERVCDSVSMRYWKFERQAEMNPLRFYLADMTDLDGTQSRKIDKQQCKVSRQLTVPTITKDSGPHCIKKYRCQKLTQQYPDSPVPAKYCQPQNGVPSKHRQCAFCKGKIMQEMKFADVVPNVKWNSTGGDSDEDYQRVTINGKDETSKGLKDMLPSGWRSDESSVRPTHGYWDYDCNVWDVSNTPGGWEWYSSRAWSSNADILQASENDPRKRNRMVCPWYTHQRQCVPDIAPWSKEWNDKQQEASKTTHCAGERGVSAAGAP